MRYCKLCESGNKKPYAPCVHCSNPVVSVVNQKTKQNEIIPVIREIFEETTDKSEPFCQRLNNKEHAFATCSKCANPVQIIGFYRNSDKETMLDKKKSYAKHYKKDVYRIGKHIQATYEVCPYRVQKIYVQNDKKTFPDAMSIKIKDLFVEHFDKVIYLAKLCTGIRYGEGFTKKLLSAYIGWDGWQYMGATLENIPWVFLYMSGNQKLFGQIIEKDGFLYKEIKKKKYGIKFKNISDELVKIAGFEKKTQYLTQSFIHHKSTPKDGELRESMKINIVLYDDAKGCQNRTILTKEIKFDHQHFFNLIHFENWQQDKKMLDMLREHGL
ncbi:MAG: hypothetical protein FWG63_11590 [Defluviitaleaceae bacterium]|nr:hypothetical protein [Defluviitaleaceae bacterium]